MVYSRVNSMGMLSSPLTGTRGLMLGSIFVFVLLFILHTAVLSYSDSPAPVLKKHKVLKRNWSVVAKDSPLEGPSPGFKKPKDFKIVGLIFYGRRATVSILDCYLQRNLASNGGFLDEVVFVVRTNDTADLAWLDQRIATVPQYRRQDVSFEYHNYTAAYDNIAPENMYVKIDDDVIFIEDTAIPAIVETKLEHPEYFLVSANIVNQPPLAWVHRHQGALKPYLPELVPAPLNFTASRWRASHLPAWQSPDPSNWWLVDDNFVPPAYGHRWLPLAAGAQLAPSIDATPVRWLDYDYNRGWWWWPAGAQLHYSFLHHLEDNDLWRYKFRIWDYEYYRLGIQFIAIWGADLVRSMPIPADDEMHLTIQMPYLQQRHAVVDGRGMVAHYSFGPQFAGMTTTDILERYRAFAEENICADHGKGAVVLGTS